MDQHGSGAGFPQSVTLSHFTVIKCDPGQSYQQGRTGCTVGSTACGCMGAGPIQSQVVQYELTALRVNRRVLGEVV